MTKEIPLNTGEVVLVDDEDYPLLSRYAWQRYGAAGYPATTMEGAFGKKHTIYMHKLILGGFWMVDHKDGNVLDARKTNIRRATRQQNNFNQKKAPMRKGKPCSSKYKGVMLAKGKWRAHIGFNKQHYWLGTFENEDDAARAYNAKALEFFGEFARLNDVPEAARDARDTAA